MRVLVIIKGDERSEAGAMPPPEELAAMGKFNDELIEAGVMLAGAGLHPTSRGVRFKFPEGRVIDGPFTESKEVIAGYWIWQVASLDEALAWLRRAPFPEREGEIELRPIYEHAELGMSDEMRRRFEAQDAKLAARS